MNDHSYPPSNERNAEHFARSVALRLSEGTQQLPYDLELYLNELIAEYLNMKDFSKILNKAVVVFNGEKFLEFKHSSPEEALAAVRKKWPDSNPLCLNIMTLEEAYQLYKKHMPA